MKVMLFGGSGMVGQGVLRESLLDPDVTAVLAVGRSPLGRTDPKLRELVVPDAGQLTGVEAELQAYDACFWCLGTSSAGMTETDYRRVTYELTVSAATTLSRLNPGMTFVYVSGAGTDSSEKGRSMWARVKGQTENAVSRLPFKATYMFRPGIIRPMHGIRSKTRSYRVLYTMLRPFLFLVRMVAPDSMTCTERVGRAMLKVARDGAPNRVVSTRDINALGG
ncbi:MAG: epimerase [Thermoplasmata archaeon]|nr:epimerase [Thermoplasmata archaeon]